MPHASQIQGALPGTIPGAIPALPAIQETAPAPTGPATTGQAAAGELGTQNQPGLLESIPWIPLVLIFAVFYFLLIAPERKTRRKREQLLASLKKGDRVMTTGGLMGSVAAVADDVITLQIADGVRARFSRQAIQTVTQDDDGAEGGGSGK